MARPLSEEKRIAILEATAEVVATLGVSAPTAKSAGASRAAAAMESTSSSMAFMIVQSPIGPRFCVDRLRATSGYDRAVERNTASGE
jgi:hypothetical protein